MTDRESHGLMHHLDNGAGRQVNVHWAYHVISFSSHKDEQELDSYRKRCDQSVVKSVFEAVGNVISDIQPVWTKGECPD